MDTAQIELAKEAGCITTRQMGLWYHGYLSGRIDTLKDTEIDLGEEFKEMQRLDALDNEEEIIRAKFEDNDIYDSIREEFKGEEHD